MKTSEEREHPVVVSIRCATYNHVNYIRKCLEGFVMQQTTFPFEAIVHDDASTDGTTEILREFADKYPNIIKPVIEKENLWSRQDGSLTKKLNENLRGKYIALCDGDDYWTDPYKLQKQVDFLESHMEFSLVHTSFGYIDKEGNDIPVPEIPLYKTLKMNIRDGYVWHKHLVHSTFILFSTVMYRTGLMEMEENRADHGMFMCCARQGKVYYIDNETTKYRITQLSVMRNSQSIVSLAIRNDIFRQLYYYTSNKYKTLPYYRYNIKARVAVAEGILSSIAYFKELTVQGKKGKICSILFRCPLNLLFLPLGFISKVIRRVNS